MKRTGTTFRAVCLAAALTAPAWGQLRNGVTPVELSSAVHLDEAGGEAQSHLERVDAFLADKQYDEAVETLRRVMENHGRKVIRLDRASPQPGGGVSRYVSVRSYCHARLGALAVNAPEALELYRQRVDPTARRWYDQGVAQRDEAALRRVVDQLFASRYGDDALAALGEIALERGDYAAAREHWERISPSLRAPAGGDAVLKGVPRGPLYVALRGVPLEEKWADIEPLFAPGSEAAPWPFYPDTDRNLAGVRARLVLVSILERALDRARVELQLLKRLCPGAKGKWGGREVDYAETLSAMIERRPTWPPVPAPAGWPTFAMSTERNSTPARGVDITGRPIWQVTLGGPISSDVETIRDLGINARRPAEDDRAILPYHPLVHRGMVLVNDSRRIKAFDLHTGKPRWPLSGVTDRDQRYGAIYEGRALTGPPQRRIGVPRFTMTAHGAKLFARMGSPVTGAPDDGALRADADYLVGLDLNAQGRLLPGFPIDPDGPKWAFEGSPLTDGTNLFIAMRRSDVRPQAHVACFNLQTGALRWRSMVCSAETPGHGQLAEVTHNLLTLHRGTIYYNTNLGAVAALRTTDGAVKWIAVYDRASRVGAAAVSHLYRDLNPCVYHQGTVLAAPADAHRIFALDAMTGQLLWRSVREVDAQGVRAVHLLGAADGAVVAGGDRLWWLNAHTGKVLGRFPDGGGPAVDHGRPSPGGFGRGTLAGKSVYWPSRERIYVFDQRAPRQIRQPIELAVRGASGGNLVMADGIVLIATAEGIIAFNETGQVKKKTNE